VDLIGLALEDLLQLKQFHHLLSHKLLRLNSFFFISSQRLN
jgi:hypothetical protein